VQRILAIVDGLSPLTREAFVLRHVAGAAYEEIGKALGKTTAQARALSHSAVQEIRRQLCNERDQQLSLLRER
jgi:DNA-directed RNA polymerase specialized sigma24 family protein